MLPVIFVGHGSPLNATEDNPFTRSLGKMGNNLKEAPKAILVISAHWLTEGSYVNLTDMPATIYDFSGFPRSLYALTYPVLGAPDVALDMMQQIDGIKGDRTHGLDHGAWAVLRHMFPEAQIPVFQLSIDFQKPMEYHYELGKKLSYLREQGVLIVGSGNIVHNLRLYYTLPEEESFPWAVEFDEWVKDRLLLKKYGSLMDYESAGSSAKLAVPSTDHYIPLLYVLGAAHQEDEISFDYERMVSSMSMRCFTLG